MAAKDRGTFLIGGAELKGLIHTSLDDKPVSGKICICPCRQTLVEASELLQASELGDKSLDGLLERAYRCISGDLENKWQYLDKFVSIRVHVSRTVWRQSLRRAAVRAPGNGRGCYSLEQKPTDLWARRSCNESAENALVLEPGELVLIPSLEHIRLAPNIGALFQTRTTVAFEGLDITPTNVIVPGFSGCLYMEVVNHTRYRMLIPDFFPIGELFFFYTAGHFTGAGPEYEQAIDQLPQAPTPIARPDRYPSVRQGFAAAVTFAMVFGVTMLSGAAAMYLFPGISEAELGGYIARLFVISAGCATVLAFGKDAVSFVTEKIAGRFGQRD